MFCDACAWWNPLPGHVPDPLDDGDNKHIL